MIAIMQGMFDRLFDGARRVVADAGTVLFRTGDGVQSLYRLSSGAVDLRRVTPEGTELVLQRAGPGEVLAEASAYSAVYHCDGVVAAKHTEVLSIPVASFRARLRADPDLSEAWAKALSRSVQAARTRAELRTIRTVRGRLDAWLVLGGTLPEKGRYQDLAAELGTTREALYRELSRRRQL
jgi:CRP-like cAMP-binding protein